MFAPLELRDWNKVSGSIGAVTLASTNPNATIQIRPTIKLPNTKGFLQPSLAYSMNPFTKLPSPTVARSAPHQSTRASTALRLSETRQNETIITAAAIGTLMKKTQRQEACSTSQPPRTGPTAVVIAVKPDHIPIA